MLKYTEIKNWKDVLTYSPRFYFNYHLFINKDLPFFLATVSATLFLIYHLIYKKDKTALLLLISLGIFSVLGILSPKMDRWGYPVAIIYFIILVYTLFLLYEYLKNKRTRNFITLFLAILAMFCTTNIADAITEKKQKSDALISVNLKAYDYIKNTVSESTDLCILPGSSYKIFNATKSYPFVSSVFNDIAYKSNNGKSTTDQLNEYNLPTFCEIKDNCKILIINSEHYKMYKELFSMVNKSEQFDNLFMQISKNSRINKFIYNEQYNSLTIYTINDEK